MLEETWLDAAEAKKLGLVTSVTPNKAKDGAKALVAGGIVLRGNFRNAPVEALAELGVRIEPTETRIAASVDDAAVPYRPEKPAEDGSWDASAAEGRMRKWASSDGSGDKAKIDWAKYRRGFSWYDDKNPEHFGSHKLPHHDVVGGELVTVRAGVIAAGNAVNGGRGGVDIPAGEMAGVKSHLEKHYAQFSMKAPWKDEQGATSDLEATALDPDGTVRSLRLALADMLARADGLAWPAAYRAHVKKLLAADLVRVRNDRSRDAIGASLDPDSAPRLGQLTE